MQTLVLGEGGRRGGGAVGDRHVLVDAGCLCPDEERSDHLAGGGSGGEPFIDVELAACRGGPAVGVLEPGQELDNFGDVPFGGVDRSAGGFSCGRDRADSFDVVPGRELFDVAPNRAVIDGDHLCGDPIPEEAR